MNVENVTWESTETDLKTALSGYSCFWLFCAGLITRARYCYTHGLKKGRMHSGELTVHFCLKNLCEMGLTVYHIPRFMGSLQVKKNVFHSFLNQRIKKTQHLHFFTMHINVHTWNL